MNIFHAATVHQQTTQVLCCIPPRFNLHSCTGSVHHHDVTLKHFHSRTAATVRFNCVPVYRSMLSDFCVFISSLAGVGVIVE